MSVAEADRAPARFIGTPAHDLGKLVKALGKLGNVAKSLVGRTRPALWETQWYWGSSFPSGHTLVVASFTCAAALCLSRLWLATREAAFVQAFLWILLVLLALGTRRALAHRRPVFPRSLARGAGAGRPHRQGAGQSGLDDGPRSPPAILLQQLADLLQNAAQLRLACCIAYRNPHRI